MDERTTRIFLGLCLLVLVWIGVYWMWQPSQEQGPKFSFDPVPMIDLGSDGADPVEPLVSDVDGFGDSGVLDKPAEKALPVIEPVVASTGNRPRLIPPEFFEHVVREGERMQTIAKEYFGSIDDWTIIAKANPGVDPQKLKGGTVLRIPKDKYNIQGVLVGGETRPGVITAHPIEGQNAGGTIEYIVQSGDSLSLISQRIYGTTRYAKFIFESNRDVLRSMDSISIGQLLKLPPAPEP